MAAITEYTSSVLNPNAPIFIPAAFQMVEDFSPEWWDLIKTSTWFREHWIQHHQEWEMFDGNNAEDDDANSLPDLFDHGFEYDFLSHKAGQPFVSMDSSAFYTPKNNSLTDIGAVLRNGNLKSLKNHQPAKYQEKPVRVINPRMSSHRIIQQPR